MDNKNTNICKKALIQGQSTCGADVEIVVDPGILVPRKYLIWQKIFGKMIMLNCKID